MTRAELEVIFLQDIGEPYAAGNRLVFLQSTIRAAIAEITQAGITLTTESDEGGISILDANLIRMYAAWLVRGRASQEAKPPQLRHALHSRLFAQKMAPEEAPDV